MRSRTDMQIIGITVPAWLCIALTATFFAVYADSAVSVTPSISDSSAWTANGIVRTIARAGNTTYIGGDFTYVGPRTGNAALTDASDGELSAELPEVAGGSVLAAVADGSGGWYIGGSFTHVGGQQRLRLAHIEADLNIDPDWNPAANSSVRSIILSGTDVYVAGDFTSAGGAARNRIAALSPQSGQATTWNPNSNNTVNTLALSGTTLYAGGAFTNIGGAARNRIAALETSSSNATAWDPNSNNTVNALALSGTTLYAGGAFTNIGGAARNRIAALDTTVDIGNATAWNPNSNNTVSALAVASSTVYAGGSFTSIGGQPRNRITALDSTVNTNNATAWNPDANGAVGTIAVDGTTIYAGGSFTEIGGSTRLRAAALDAASANATSWNPKASSTVETIAVNGSNVFIGGVFTSIGGSPRNRLAALDPYGNLSGWNPDVNGSVNTLTLSQDGSTVYAGGAFTTVNIHQQNPGLTRNRIAAFNAASGDVIGWNPNADGAVNTLALSGTTLYAGGAFTNIGGAVRNRIAALSPQTGQATAWDANADGAVNALALSGTTLYAGGAFANIGAAARNRIAALDTTVATNNATTWNPNSNNAVSTLALSGTKLYAGGSFTSIGGASRNYVAALDTTVDTSNALAWNPASTGSSVTALAVSGQTVYVGGTFTVIGGEARTNLAAVEAGSGNATGWNPVAQAAVRALSATDANVYAGGDFVKAGTSAQQGFAQFTSAPELDTPPTIQGVAIAEEQLSCDKGSWKNGPLTYFYQWYKNGIAISSATGQTYKTAEGDALSAMACKVTVENAGGSANATSDPVTIAAKPKPPEQPEQPEQPEPTEDDTPAVSGFSIKHKVIMQNMKRRTARSEFSFTVSKFALAKIKIYHLKSGKKVAGQCISVKKKQRKSKAIKGAAGCSRLVWVRTILRTAQPGNQIVPFNARTYYGEPMRPGYYVAELVGFSTSNKPSNKEKLSFSILS